MLRPLILIAVLLLSAVRAGQAVENAYPLKGDDGNPILNHRVSPRHESRIDKLPGAIVAGNPNGKVTLAEFYDLNCSYCRLATKDIARLVRAHPELRLVLVPFPVFGIPSIQGTLVELAVARMVPPEKFYEFHRKLFEARGTIGSARALAQAEALGLDAQEVIRIANDDAMGKIMIAHVELGNALAIAVTPGFVIKGVAILGYPGGKSMATIIENALRCGAVVCNDVR
jgi:protein-disulfide isomerase